MFQVAVNSSQRPQAQGRALTPAVDVIEHATGVTLFADLPGVSQDRLTVRIESNVLTIDGEVSIEGTNAAEATHVELGVPRFRRVFELRKDLDAERISAELRDGVLTLAIPKAAHAQPRKIEVSVQ